MIFVKTNVMPYAQRNYVMLGGGAGMDFDTSVYPWDGSETEPSNMTGFVNDAAVYYHTSVYPWMGARLSLPTAARAMWHVGHHR